MAVSRGVGFVIEGGGGLERSVGIQSKEGIVRPGPTHQGGKSMASPSGSVALNSPTTVPIGWFSAMARDEVEFKS